MANKIIHEGFGRYSVEGPTANDRWLVFKMDGNWHGASLYDYKRSVKGLDSKEAVFEQLEQIASPSQEPHVSHGEAGE